MFKETTSIEKITINENAKITTIGESAFEGCTKLKSLNIDWSYVTTIGARAFYNCSSLTGSTQLNSGCSIGENAFYNCPFDASK
jgi:hypothetical protein